MHPKHRIIYILAIVLVVFIALFFLGKNYTYAPEDSNSINIQKQKPLINEEKIVIDEVTDSYDIKIQYPKSSYENINNDFNRLVSESIYAFKDLGADLPLITSEKYFLSIEYPKIIEGMGYITYIFYIYMYTGGAHGNTDIKTFTYNNQGELIALGDLFKDKNYLNTISEKSRKILMDKIGDSSSTDMISSGTEALRENFENFAISQNGLVFFFPQYQVAPYALGPQEITISFEDLDLINL